MPQKRTHGSRPAFGTGTPLAEEFEQHRDAATHAVYYIASSDGEWIYVGCTSQLIQRLKSHATTKPWFTRDCVIYTEWYDDRPTALEREHHAIADLLPRHNELVPTPTGPSPKPSVPFAPLSSIDQHIGAICANGDGQPVFTTASGLCRRCYDQTA